MKELSHLAQVDRMLSQQSLYYLCKEVLGYKDVVPHIHGDFCHFLTHPQYGRFRQGTLPRSWFKTWVGTVGLSIWLTLPDEEAIYKDIFPYKGPDIRVLIASNVIDNAAKMVHKIKDEWMNNDRLKAAFPELIPDYNKTRWSDHAAEMKRTIKATEATYTAVGVGGSVISQHFDHIIEDDLVYAKKDDFTGMELMPSQEDIDNAIGWHKLTYSLLANPQTGCMTNVGTRWAPLDIINYIRKYEPHYKCFEIAATKDAKWPIMDNTDCNWPERYDKETMEQIFASQGTRIAETQYLNRPTSTEDKGFAIEYITQHTSLSPEYPQNLAYKTIVDLAGWGDTKGTARNVILTGARDSKNHIWISRVDSGRFDPTEVIALFKHHSKQFNSKIYIEEIQYQRAVRHFARQEMERTGETYLIESLPYDGRKNAKELRIKSIEPIVSNGMLHTLASMKSLMEEFEFYPRSRTVDILDCIGYLIRVAKPPMQEYKKELIDPFEISQIEKDLREKAHPQQFLPSLNIVLDGRIVDVG